MKSSHLILFLILFWIILLFYKRREYFSHSSNMHRTGKVKLNIKSLKSLLTPTPRVEESRYVQLYNKGICSGYNLPPTYAIPGTEQAGNIKFCKCAQGSGIPGGLIPARNMPNSACNKHDFTRSGAI